MKQPRGIRNNNPGNIRWGDPWQGLVPESQRTDTAFCQFRSPAWGIRALAITLTTYQDKHGLNTVAGIVSRWAPPSENNTQAYIRSVCDFGGLLPNAPLDVTEFSTSEKLAKAITWHENGLMPYSDLQIQEGLRMAGIIKPQRPLATPVGAGAATAGATGAVAAAVEGYQQIRPLMQSFDSGSYWGTLAVGTLVFVSIAAAIYAYWKNHQRMQA